MKRRSFLAGLLGTTAAVALPMPKIEADLAVKTVEKMYAIGGGGGGMERIIGIAMHSAGPGEPLRVLLNGPIGTTEYSAGLIDSASLFVHSRDQVYAGNIVTDANLAEWTHSSPEMILEDIDMMRGQLREAYLQDMQMSVDYPVEQGAPIKLVGKLPWEK